ncbi:hypothetical protein Save01_09181 [Streptomyces avermitilis]
MGFACGECLECLQEGVAVGGDEGGAVVEHGAGVGEGVSDVGEVEAGVVGEVGVQGLGLGAQGRLRLGRHQPRPHPWTAGSSLLATTGILAGGWSPRNVVGGCV